MLKKLALLSILLTSVPATTTLHWGIPSAKQEEVPYPGEQFHDLTEKYGAIYVGDKTKKHVYLTFDNGYENGYTDEILDTLKEKKVPATFFATGHYVSSSPALVKRMVADGHIIGNHTKSHPDLTKLDQEIFRQELEALEKQVANLTKQKEMKYMRPPEGTFSEQTLEFARAAGYKQVFWSLAYADWDTNKQLGAIHAKEIVLNKLHPGAIILLHTVSKDNAEALGDIIDIAKKRGYTFHSLDELQ